MKMRRIVLSLFVCVWIAVGWAAPAHAQITSARVTVTTTATLIAAGTGDGQAFTIKNGDASAAIDLGPSTVTSGTGFSLAAGEVLTLTLRNGVSIYGITASGSVTVHRMSGPPTGVSLLSTAGGGGSGGSFNGVLLDAAGGDAVTDTANNAVRVNVIAGGGAGGTSSNFGAALPAAGTAAGFSDGTNMQAGRVFDADSGAGTQYVQGVQIRAAASGGSADIPGDATFGLDVDVMRMPADATELPAPLLAANNMSLPTAPWVLSANMCYDGTLMDLCPTSTAGSGVIDPNTQRVTTATDDPVSLAAVKQDANMVAHDAPDAGNPVKIGGYASTAPPTAVSAGADRVNAWYTLNGAAVVQNVDPCSGVKTYVPISINTATTTQLVAASASNYVHVCSINLGPTAGAQNAALIEDDTAACASPTAGMAGGTTAATGWNFPANGGLAFGSGLATVAQTATTNRYVCLITSTTAQTSGVMSYVLAAY